MIMFLCNTHKTKVHALFVEVKRKYSHGAFAYDQNRPRRMARDVDIASVECGYKRANLGLAHAARAT